MPLRAGAADKYGGRYEGLWTISCLADVMGERADAIRLEPPGEEGEGVEFWILKNGAREYHQVKRQRGRGERWTISSLGTPPRVGKESVLSNFAGGLVVGALAAVNAFGEVRDPQTRKILAGPRLEDGTLGDTVELLPEAAARLRWGESTTLGIVATNARLSKPQVSKVAQMGHDGLARAVYPVHTTVDGDVVFAAATGGVEVAPDVVGAWGARVLEDAIVRAVLAAEGIPGLPAARDLAR